MNTQYDDHSPDSFQLAVRLREQGRPIGVDRLHLKRVAVAREAGRQALVVVKRVREVALHIFRRRFASHRSVVRSLPRLVVIRVALRTRFR